MSLTSYTYLTNLTLFLRRLEFVSRLHDQPVLLFTLGMPIAISETTTVPLVMSSLEVTYPDTAELLIFSTTTDSDGLAEPLH